MSASPLAGLVSCATVAFITGLLVVRLAEGWSRRRRLLDIPNHRSSHVVPTPRLGGLGLAAGATAGMVAWPGGLEPATVLILGTGLALAAVGLADDVGRVGVRGKALAQLAAAIVAATTLQPTLDLDLPAVQLSIDGPVAVAVSAVWLLAVINAFNFMDGIDGLIGWVSATISLIGLGIAAPAGIPILATVAAASLGFLIWNHAPASIFMGDVGSQFLGLVVGAALLAPGPTGSVPAVAVMLLVVPLVLDTGITLVRRARAGKDLFAGHREHLYQRLVQTGLSHRAVAAGYAVACGLGGIVGVVWTGLPEIAQALATVAIVIVAVQFVRSVENLERSLAEPVAPGRPAGA